MKLNFKIPFFGNLLGKKPIPEPTQEDIAVRAVYDKAIAAEPEQFIFTYEIGLFLEIYYQNLYKFVIKDEVKATGEWESEIHSGPEYFFAYLGEHRISAADDLSERVFNVLEKVYKERFPEQYKAIVAKEKARVAPLIKKQKEKARLAKIQKQKAYSAKLNDWIQRNR